MSRAPLSEEAWSTVFRLRCKSKQGQSLTSSEHDLVERAFATNRDRYAAMEADVFDATVPFGSSARAPR